jgi:hypothetical protein
MPARTDESRIACQTFYGSQACGPGIRQRAYDLLAEPRRNAGGRSFLTSISRWDDRTIAPHAPSAWAMRSSEIVRCLSPEGESASSRRLRLSFIQVFVLKL